MQRDTNGEIIEKGQSVLPNTRQIKRTCKKELYRTIKKGKLYIPKEKFEAGHELYVQKVIGNLVWIFEHRSNRKKQADWWEQHVAPELSSLWNVDQKKLCSLFRQAYGG